mmetsp:Transcript_34064/g.49378  ORF Transcript_34064/g.49378 Transcript_34064/m.49378 type:complete len:174 (-) Transcript_34064:1652-2173(-)
MDAPQGAFFVPALILKFGMLMSTRESVRVLNTSIFYDTISNARVILFPSFQIDQKFAHVFCILVWGYSFSVIRARWNFVQLVNDSKSWHKVSKSKKEMDGKIISVDLFFGCRYKAENITSNTLCGSVEKGEVKVESPFCLASMILSLFIYLLVVKLEMNSTVNQLVYTVLFLS